MMRSNTTDQPETKAIDLRYAKRISVIAALGGLLFGFDTAIISGTISFIKPYFQLNEAALGWAVSCILVGCAIGAVVAGKLADAIGRKKVLMICGILFGLTGVSAGFAFSFFVFVVSRIIGGLAVGAAAMVAPMYIAETVPAAWRGRLVSLYQMAIVAGILLAYLSNYAFLGVGADAWRWMFASQVVPSICFIVFLFGVPETPRWLVRNSEVQQGFDVLMKIGGEKFANDELTAIRTTQSQGNARWQDVLLPKYRKVLWIGVTVAAFQQITGINAILYYAPEIFKQTGVSNSNALLQSIGIGVVMLGSTFLAIKFIDSAGRRLLLLVGNVVMAVSLTGVALCFHYSFFGYYLVFVLLVVYIAGFSASLGAVTWVLLSELFPNSIRGIAMSLSTFVLWVADFIASFSFPILNKQLGPSYTLMLFAALCVIYFIYVKIKIPETKGKTLEEMEQIISR